MKFGEKLFQTKSVQNYCHACHTRFARLLSSPVLLRKFTKLVIRKYRPIPTTRASYFSLGLFYFHDFPLRASAGTDYAWRNKSWQGHALVFKMFFFFFDIIYTLQKWLKLCWWSPIKYTSVPSESISWLSEWVSVLKGLYFCFVAMVTFLASTSAHAHQLLAFFWMTVWTF